MPFGIIGRTGPGVRQVLGFGIGPWEGVLLGTNLGGAIVTNGDFTAMWPSSQITLGKLIVIITDINTTWSACVGTTRLIESLTSYHHLP